MKILSIIILAVSVLTSSCNYIPCSSSSDLTNVKNIPESSEIAGIYKPDEFTKRDVTGYSNSDSTYLLLTKDGVLYLKNFAKSTFTDNTIDTSIKISGKGTWACSYKRKTTTINSEIGLSDLLIVSHTIFSLYKKDNKFVILLETGDPDECLAVRLFQQ